MESYRALQQANLAKAVSGVVGNPKGKSKQDQAIINGDFFAAFLQLIMQSGEQAGDDFLSQLAIPTEGGTDLNSGTAPEDLLASMLNGTAVGGFGTLFNNGDSMAELNAILGQEANQLTNENAVSNEALAQNAKLLQEMLIAQASGIGGLSGSQTETGLNSATVMQGTQSQTIIPLYKMLFGNEQSSANNATAGTENNPAGVVTGITGVAGQNGEGGSSSEALFNGDMNFRNSVAQAQKLLKNQAEPTEDETLSSENAAQGLNAAKFEVITPEKQILPTAQAKVDLSDLSEQIKNGISSGALTDKKEFSVKLKPEGLGEVTVRLISEQNKVSVSIVTATAEAAKALNNQLPTLRETMRAMQIEVRDVTTQAENNFEAAQQSLQRQQQQQQNQFTENRRYHHAPSFNGDFSNELDEVAIDTAKVISNERMDMYI